MIFLLFLDEKMCYIRFKTLFRGKYGNLSYV